MEFFPIPLNSNYTLHCADVFKKSDLKNNYQIIPSDLVFVDLSQFKFKLKRHSDIHLKMIIKKKNYSKATKLISLQYNLGKSDKPSLLDINM